MNTVTPAAPGPYLPSSTVSTQWLADHLGADNLAIVAAANRVRLLSLRLDVAISTIVVYDENDGLCASESAHTLREAGFERVAVLTGGRQKWLSEQRPVDLHELAHRNGRSPLYTGYVYTGYVYASVDPGYVEPRLA
ncbi:rhodanese-like domain-containing protein [Agreia sp. Leaf335]|uniref:rhodanese-like domain-containing protein n=1 Tax=Agreia sp. Leaf335 TaxID=1736340 RepID=UPI0012E0D524|nr:rhodanese-like domain-containing protein [Agreia sp. Leaf335]